MRASTSSSSLSSSERFWKTDPLDLMLGLISTFLVAHAISWPYLLGLRICFFERRQFLWVNWKDLHARLPAHFAARLAILAGFEDLFLREKAVLVGELERFARQVARTLRRTATPVRSINHGELGGVVGKVATSHLVRDSLVQASQKGLASRVALCFTQLLLQLFDLVMSCLQSSAILCHKLFLGLGLIPDAGLFPGLGRSRSLHFREGSLLGLLHLGHNCFGLGDVCLSHALLCRGLSLGSKDIGRSQVLPSPFARLCGLRFFLLDRCEDGSVLHSLANSLLGSNLNLSLRLLGLPHHFASALAILRRLSFPLLQLVCHDLVVASELALLRNLHPQCRLCFLRVGESLLGLSRVGRDGDLLLLPRFGSLGGLGAGECLDDLGLVEL